MEKSCAISGKVHIEVNEDNNKIITAVIFHAFNIVHATTFLNYLPLSSLFINGRPYNVRES